MRRNARDVFETESTSELLNNREPMKPDGLRINLVTSLAILSAIILFYHSIYADASERSISFNGGFLPPQSDVDYRSISENGFYYCKYDIGAVSDEFRELANFRLYADGGLLYSLEKAPGSDVYISNSGIVAFMDHTYHFKGELTVVFYSESGGRLYSRKFKGASLFGFSPSGEMFGVGTPGRLYVITPRSGGLDEYRGGYQFDISADDNLVAVADGQRIYVYENGTVVDEISAETEYPRKIRISPDNRRVALIDKRHLRIYDIDDGSVLFSDELAGNLSFKDLGYQRNGNLECGIHYRDNEYSRGILRIYNPDGGIIYQGEENSRYIKSPPPPENLGNSILDYDPVPWPFAPFDSMCTVWNHYEQHMSYGTSDWSYLHQGLDMITPIGESTYAVQSGIVKCVLSIGGDSYWRLAISPQQDPGWSSGWLYAHLVHSSIQVDVGDTVDIYDYLGDIIFWSQDWGHIHFVEITDSGLVWQYFDNQWGIDFNPLLALTSDEDIFPPIFDDVFPGEKFAFSPNETIMQYQDPDSLHGDIDIITKIRDYSGNSDWQLPAYQLNYWIVSIAGGDTILPRTLGDILNHSYDFYESDLYEPYALLQYKRDDILLPPVWMDTVRDYYHILTNNNGDSLAELSESQLSFHSGDFPDGSYRIFVEAGDAYDNITLDSMDVIFHNGNVGVADENGNLPGRFALFQNYPNPFNGSTRLSYFLPADGFVKLSVYDIEGREIETVVEEFQRAGEHSLGYSANDLPSGVYFLKLKSAGFSAFRKMILMK